MFRKIVEFHAADYMLKIHDTFVFLKSRMGAHWTNQLLTGQWQ